MQALVDELSKIVLYDVQDPVHSPWGILQYLVDDPDLDAVQYPMYLVPVPVHCWPDGSTFDGDVMYAAEVPRLYSDIVHLQSKEGVRVMFKDDGCQTISGEVWIPLFRSDHTYYIVTDHAGPVLLNVFVLGFHMVDYLTSR
jgi:hypothetical protein